MNRKYFKFFTCLVLIFLLSCVSIVSLAANEDLSVEESAESEPLPPEDGNSESPVEAEQIEEQPAEELESIVEDLPEASIQSPMPFIVSPIPVNDPDPDINLNSPEYQESITANPGSHPTAPLDYLTDGDMTTRWSSSGATELVLIDIIYNNTFSINKIVLKEYWSRISNFHLQYLNAQTGLWETFYSGSTLGNGVEVVIDDFGTIVAAGLRISMTKSSASLAISLYEFQAYYMPPEIPDELEVTVNYRNYEDDALLTEHIETVLTDDSFEFNTDATFTTSSGDEYSRRDGEPASFSYTFQELLTLIEDGQELVFDVYYEPSNAGLDTVYWYASGSNDNNDGATLETSVRTFERAKELVAKNGTIYICNTIAITGNATWELPEGATIMRHPTLYSNYMVNIKANGNLTLKNITLDGGRTTAYRAIINLEARTSNLTLQENAVLQNNLNSGSKGGAIYNLGTVTIDGGSIINNRCNDYGGGIYSNYPGTVTLNSGEVSHNISGNGAGGIHNSGGVFNMTGGSISYNGPLNASFAPDIGGLACEKSPSSPGPAVNPSGSITGGSISYNQGKQIGGFAIGNTTFNIENLEVKGNAPIDLTSNGPTASAAFFGNSTITMKNCVITEQEAQHVPVIKNISTLSLEDCTITNNLCKGAILSSRETSDTTLIGNIRVIDNFNDVNHRVESNLRVDTQYLNVGTPYKLKTLTEDFRLSFNGKGHLARGYGHSITYADLDKLTADNNVYGVGIYSNGLYFNARPTTIAFVTGTVQKTAPTQTSVQLAMTRVSSSTYKYLLFSTETGPVPLTDYTITVNTTTKIMTISHTSDIAPGTYWVAPLTQTSEFNIQGYRTMIEVLPM